MPPLIWLLIALVVALVATGFGLSWHATRKLHRKVDAAFGHTPEIPEGLRNAAAYWEDVNADAPDPLCVDDLTWNDLHMDGVFANLNTCHSALGDARLYTALRRPVRERPLALEREALTRLLGQDAALRRRVQYEMARLGRWNGSSMGFVQFHAGSLHFPRRWLYQLLAFLPLLALPLFFYSIPLAAVLLLVAVTVNIQTYTMVKLKNESGFLSVRFLASSLRCSRHLAALLRPCAPQLAAQLDDAAREMGHLRRSCNVLALNDFLESNALLDPQIFILLPLISYGKALERLQQAQQVVGNLYELLGDVDLAAGILSLRHSLPYWATPQATEENELSTDGIYHILLDEAVPNDGAFARNVLFTGSNASGKSTFIKALALNCILAQSLNTCTARAFRYRPGAVASSMAVQDSVIDGESYFIAEIKSMRRLLEILDVSSFSYFFIDEILKGTNTVERIAAAASVLNYLCRDNCLCFAATHDIELTVLLQDGYDNYHFEEQVQQRNVTFDYKLHPGPATSRNAILLLEHTGFPPEITARAEASAASFDRDGQWV